MIQCTYIVHFETINFLGRFTNFVSIHFQSEKRKGKSWFKRISRKRSGSSDSVG